MSEERSRDLSILFSEKLDDPNLSEDYTVDDFYDDMGILKENRTDFGTAAILKRVLERRKK